MMVMKRYLVPALLLAILGGGLLVLFVKGRNEETVSVPAAAPQVEGDIVPIVDCNIPEEALRPYSKAIPGEGIRTILERNYKKGMPLVEMTFLQRDLDGNVRPLALSTVQLSPMSGNGGIMGLQGAHGMRLAVSDDPNVAAALCFGEGYRVTYYTPVTGGAAVQPIPPYPSFRVPEAMPPNTVYRVQLIVEDEVRRRQLEQEQVTERRHRQEIVQAESIVINAAYPSHTDDASWAAIYYHDDVPGKEGYDHMSTGLIALPGPNPLGGELLVIKVDDGRSERATIHPWCYIGSLQKRAIRLPEDADFVVDEEQFVEITLDIEQLDSLLAEGYKGVGFCMGQEAEVPIFTAKFPGVSSQQSTVESTLVSARVVPGTFYLRAMRSLSGGVPLGQVVIGPESGKVYTIPRSQSMETPDDVEQMQPDAP